MSSVRAAIEGNGLACARVMRRDTCAGYRHRKPTTPSHLDCPGAAKTEITPWHAAGLVTTQKVGRVRTCKLSLRGLQEEAAWIERYRQLWDARFNEMDKVVAELKSKEKVDGRRKR